MTQEQATAAPHPGQARERSMIFALGTDAVMLTSLLIAAIWANSLMMIAEFMRGSLLVSLEVILLLLMRRVHRGRIQGFDYGSAKLEQFGNLVVGTAMGLAGVWVGVTAVHRWLAPPEQAEYGLAFAALVAAANVAQNVVAFRALWRAGKDGTSIIMNGQIRIRLTRFVSSLLVLLALLVNAIEGDGPVAVAAEVLGSLLVAGVMLELSFSLWRKALPSLLDRTLGERTQMAINRVLARHFDQYDTLVSVRSRLVGDTPVVEVVLGFAPSLSIGQVQPVVDAVRGDVQDRVPGAQVTVVPVAADLSDRSTPPAFPPSGIGR